MNINEERGVVAFPYRDIIDEIVEWVRKKTLRNNSFRQSGDGIYAYFNIPLRLTKKFTFIKYLMIDICVYERDNEHGIINDGEGRCDVWGPQLVKGKLNGVNIEIKCYSSNKELITKSLETTLYHELNHAYEYWASIKNTGSKNFSLHQGYKSNFRAYDISDKKMASMFSMFLYNVHAESEFNAQISEVYSELKNMNSTRKTYVGDIKKTSTYKIYAKSIENLPKIIAYLKQHPYEAECTFERYEDMTGYKFTPYNKTIDGLIDEFNRKSKFLLKKFFKKICKAASLYYDTIENNKLRENYKISNNDIKLMVKESLLRLLSF